MSIEKAFDPTVSRTATSSGTQVPDRSLEVDSGDRIPFDASSPDLTGPGVTSSEMFSSDIDAPMPPPDEQHSGSDAEQVAQKVRARLGDADSRVRDFVERRPLAAVAGAVAAGFIIGRIVSRG